MANAQIVFTQGSTTGGPGYALMGETGESVIVSNGDDSGVVNWRFEVLDVGVDSSVQQGVVQDGAVPTWTFDPDETGCYVVRLTTEDDEGNLYVDERVFGVLETNGLLIPSFMVDAGSLNFVFDEVENTKGWSPFVNAWLKLVASKSGTVVTQYTATASYVCDSRTGVADYAIICAPSAPATITLPVASAGRVIKVKNRTAYPVTVAGGAPVEGDVAGVVLNVAGQAIELLCDGSAWQIMGAR